MLALFDMLFFMSNPFFQFASQGDPFSLVLAISMTFFDTFPFPRIFRGFFSPHRDEIYPAYGLLLSSSLPCDCYCMIPFSYMNRVNFEFALCGISSNNQWISTALFTKNNME